jgi:regulator of RNase E activity RraA
MATPSQIQQLQEYTACDISDALLKLKVPNCGFLPDLNVYSPASPPPGSKPTIAPASTVLFAPRNSTDLSGYPESNIPAGQHWVDLTESGSVVVISQPKGQICAVLGGIMALRMKVVGARGVIAHGRVRDLEELRETGLNVGILLVKIENFLVIPSKIFLILSIKFANLFELR